MMTDLEAIALAQSGDARGLEHLYRTYAPIVRKRAARLLGNDADADDLIQDLFLRVQTQLHRFRGEASFSTWIFRIASNLVIDQLRSRTLQAEVAIRQSDDAGRGHQRPERSTDVREATIRDPRDFEARVTAEVVLSGGLRQLSDRHRLLLTLNKLEGVSLREIATSLRVPEGTIRSQLFQARRHLAEVLR